LSSAEWSAMFKIPIWLHFIQNHLSAIHSFRIAQPFLNLYYSSISFGI
jgi:hypothetical protein